MDLSKPQAPKPKYRLHTLGCKANWNDGQGIEADLLRRGWVSESGAPDVCIINSCTVTDEADRQSRNLAQRLKRQYPSARIVFTGCAAEVNPQAIAKSPGVDYVIGNRDKAHLADWLEQALAKPAPVTTEVLGSVEGYAEMRSRHPMDREWPLPDLDIDLNLTQSRRTRAFLKVQDGCNEFCTYCVIPYARGPSRNLNFDDVVARVEALVQDGVREVILTGINLGDYQTSGEADGITALARAVLERTGLERLRLSSLDPTEITPALRGLLGEQAGRFCPHFHVSLQSPHPRILRLMKRKYSAAQAAECLEAIAELPTSEPGGVFVGMDVIAGFPGESDEDFDWGLSRLRELPWSRLHVFPYSEREGTPATRLSGVVYPHVRAERARRLRELSLERLRSRSEQVLKTVQAGKTLEHILIDGRRPGADSGKQRWLGYTRNHLRVELLPRLGRQLNALTDARPTELRWEAGSGEVVFVEAAAAAHEKSS